MFSIDISGPSRISKFMPTTSIITIASDIRNTGVTFSPLLLSFLAVASKIAPPAPSAAAGVGLVIPPKINYKDIAAKRRRATIFVILIIGFTAGPAVSLYGSPTVSPVTAAL